MEHQDRGGDGYPLVMLPGWGQTQAMFRHQYDDPGSAHRVITLDHRGHGHSAKPDHGYRIARLATDVNELLDHLGLAGDGVGSQPRQRAHFPFLLNPPAFNKVVEDFPGS